MTAASTASSETLPEGDDDPNLTYIAVGRAIHSWEGMEQALAYLFLKFRGIPDTPSNLATYGSRHRRFVDRIAAVKSAAQTYFIRKPDQEKEGVFSRLIEAVQLLSIERHRIAHGHISMVAEMKNPEMTERVMAISAPVKYRWAAPFYSTTGLRTDPFGKGSKDINLLTDQFMKLHNEVVAFVNALLPT